jgi:ADP-ribose pyrophosphatase
MAEFEVKTSQRTHEGALSNVRVDAVEMPDGSVAEREVVEHDNAVAVVAMEPDGNVILIRHYRHPVRTRVLEIPAGKLDVDGEAPPDAARRELAEEVGLEADDLVELLHFHNSAGWSEEATTVYLAVDVRPCGVPEGFTAEHEEADLQIVRMGLDEALELVDSGEINDAKTVIGLLLADRHLANDERSKGS